jgi:hypothetical protein
MSLPIYLEDGFEYSSELKQVRCFIEYYNYHINPHPSTQQTGEDGTRRTHA